MRRLNGMMLCAVLAVTVAVFVSAPVAMGQGGNRGMMVIDDGNQRHAISYAEPDVEAVTSPYVNRNDLPVFVEQLSLSDAQASAVERLITKYLEAFRDLVREQHPKPGDEDGVSFVRPRAAGGDDDEGEIAKPPAPADLRQAAEGEGDQAGPEDRLVNVQDILAEELKKDGIIRESLDELPVEPGIGIGISVDAPAEDGELPQPSIDVSISFGGEDDRLDEALRAKLEAAAERAVPRIAEAVREQAMADMMERMQGGEGRSPAEEIADRFDEIDALHTRVAAFKAEADALLQRLYSNVKRLLSEAQLEQWPAFERALRRIKTLPWGQLDGESVDLVKVVDDLGLEPEVEKKIHEHVLTYEQELDAALKRRNDLLETADAVIDRSLYIGEYDEAKSVAERLASARLRIRSTNDRAIETLSGALGGRDGERLRREALAEAYPRIYRRTIGQEAFDGAIASDGIDEETRLLVIDLAQQHGQRIAEVNDRLFRSVRREQENELTRGIERAVATLRNQEGGMTEPGVASGIARAFQERRDLDARYMGMLYEMLPKDVVASLPALPKHKVGDEVGAEHREEPVAVELD